MFKDRREAGRLLAKGLLEFKGKDVIILAIPRGGVVVGNELAEALNAPLDLIIPRKIGAPDNPELAIGAVAEDGTMILSHDILRHMGVSDGYIRDEARRQVEEIRRRMKEYRGERLRPSLKGKVVILVDDGVATGATIRAAIMSIRRQGPALMVVAVPVGPPDTIGELKREADRVVCLSSPEPFFAIGQFYLNFEQVGDEEVIQILNRAKGAS